jgi:hypothetical protein
LDYKSTYFFLKNKIFIKKNIMPENYDEVLKRQLLLIKYDLNKTLSENLHLIKNNKIIFEQEKPFLDDYYGSEDYTEWAQGELESARAKNYPNFCKYRDKALTPVNKQGVEGKEALAKATLEDGKEIFFCLYQSAGGKGIWIHPESTIKFADSGGDIMSFVLSEVDRIMRDYPEYNTEDELIENMSQLLIPNGRPAVISFNSGSNKYTLRMQWDSKSKRWWNSGYKVIGTQIKYEEPVWVDPRDEWDRFVDSFGMAIYLTTMLVSAFITRGASLSVIATTVGIDIVLSGVIAQRDLEKGENVAAVLGMLFTLLPFLNLSSKWLGISDEVTESLAKKILASNLNSKSSVSKWIKLYKSLSIEEQRGLRQFLKYKDTQIQKLTDEVIKVGSGLGKTKRAEQLAKILPNEIYQLSLKNPEILTKPSTWVKLRTNPITHLGAFFILNYLGKPLNDESKKTLSEIHTIVSPQLMNEIIFNLTNVDDPNVILNNTEVNNAINEIIDKKTKEFASSWQFEEHVDDSIRAVVSDTINNSGGKYEVITQEQPLIPLEGDFDVLDSTYREKGYLPFDEVENWGDIDASDKGYIINGIKYVKQIKKND